MVGVSLIVSSLEERMCRSLFIKTLAVWNAFRAVSRITTRAGQPADPKQSQWNDRSAQS